MPKRKLLLIHETLAGGGAERVLIDLLHHIDYTRYDLTLLLVYATGVYMEQIPNAVKLLHINVERKHWMERVLFRCKPLLDRWQRHDIDRVLGNQQFDVIASFMEGPAMVYHSMVTHRAPRNVTWVHTDVQHNHWSLKFHGSRARELARYKLMDRVVCVSHGALSGFEACFGNDIPRIVQHNPIDRKTIVARAQMDMVPTRRFTLCNVGRLVQSKRQDRIIEAVAMLRNRGVDVDAWIVGTGPLENRLKALSSQLAVDDRVKFCGFCSNPYPLVRACNAFLLTSEAEGYPTVVCEALCLGKPVVTTLVAGVDELVGNDAGIVCEHRVEEIAAAIERLASSTQLTLELSNAAVRRGGEFDIARTMHNIEQLL